MEILIGCFLTDGSFLLEGLFASKIAATPYLETIYNYNIVAFFIYALHFDWIKLSIDVE